ncbi:MAG TPA: zinc-dependent alcohol dehydrogenase family protein [Solirubrobacteraceae bacterium]|jgi:propanol-preferring alcohol dehydrogenase|nr:zinc-dependent alcohol dehydrogenase family protein [Solirubrobacteraceae bacterium]
MRAMVFEAVGEPLREVERPIPHAAPGQLLIRVHTCAVCRTDLHLIDGEVEIPAPPRILGHMIVGTVEALGERAGEGAGGTALGARVGVPWLGWTDGTCEYCRSGRENLCPNARFTGRDIDGGFAQYTVADARFCFPIPEGYSDEQASPLMCAGLIGYRALRMCGEARRIGLYGFGDSAHILTQVCRWQGREVYAFTRAGDEETQAFALELGAVWAGGSEEAPPEPLDAAIVFAPVGALATAALRALAPGGVVVCAGIHMSDIPSFPYEILWMERSLRSVANLTRLDGSEFLELAPRVPVVTRVTPYPLAAVNDALADLRAGRFTGAAVVLVDA